MNKTIKFLTTLLLLAVSVGAWAQTTYKLTQVTSVEAGGLYVFEQDGYVMNNTCSSSALQTTNTYKTTGLTGKETYVWTLEKATKGFYMKNVSNIEDENYLYNGSSTNVSLSGNKSDWVFNFQNDNTVLIQNTGNSNRFLGYTSSTSHAYKAYATSNFSSYPHAIKVYMLEEETGGTELSACDLTLSPISLSFDLYNNSSAQTISYTTSSTGAVTVSGGDGYVTTSVNATNKTITVTPTAVTPSAQTITVNQAADETYAAGSVTFTVSITDSTPFTGGDVTFVCGEDKSSEQSLTKNGVTMSFDSSDGGTWNRTDNYRLYSGQSMTISTATGKITSITFTISQNNFSGDGYNSETKTWTGNESSVTLAADGGQVRFTPVVVTVDTSGKQPAGLAYETTEYSVNLGETFSTPTLTNPNNLSVTYASSNESVATVNEETGVVTILAAGTTTITASSEETEQYLEGSATYTLTVVDPNAPGTENNPYTVAQALGATPADNVYVQGTISTITEVSAEYGNATYRISDDGTTANEMIIYRGKYLNNVAFTSDDQIVVGDVVKVYGKLSNYQGANQMAQGNYIVTLQGSKPSPEMSFPEESYSATLGETFTAPALTITPNTLTVTYSSSDTSVATVNETSGEVNLLAAGETTITATFAGNDDYRSATASYDLTVTDPNAPNGTIDNPYRVQDVIDGTATGNVYVKGYIVGEYVGNTTAPHTSGFTNDGNIAIADVFTTAPTASGSIPVQLPTNALKSAWGNKTNNGEFITYEVLLKGNVDTYFSVKGIKSTSEVTATGVYVKIASSGKSSYCASDTIELVDGVNAYIVTNVTSTSATMTQLTGAVPANEGIMLVGNGGAEYTLPIAIATEAASVSGNLLIGTASGENVQEEEGKTYLALKNGEFVVMNPGTVKPHKAYLSVDSSVIGNNSKLAITYEENNATAINEVQTTKEDGVFYNLNGMRVSAPQKGIYILNGKKIIVK